MKTRFNAYDKTLYEFIDNIFVVCPSCSEQAIVKSQGIFPEKKDAEVKLICTNCGLNKYYDEKPKGRTIPGKNEISYTYRSLILGTNVDPFFRIPLWLQRKFPYGLLWAYNYDHLSFIEKHISAEMRERNATMNYHESLGCKLPKWMTSKKNRQELLKGIDKLKKK